MKIVKFREWTCTLEVDHYKNNDRIALQLIELTTGEPVATATVNYPEFPLAPGHVIIKDYSENEGILQALIDAEVVSKPKVYLQFGYVSCPVCKLLIKEI
jgi:hypothetical protein